MSWADTTILSVDTETTGLDWNSDRIVQLGATIFTAGKARKTYTWLLRSGHRSNPEAVAVHGITDEMQMTGERPGRPLREIARWINQMRCRDLPIVIMNAPFDLNFLIAEWIRWEIPFCLDGLFVFDPLVVDRFYSRNRIPALTKGQRTLKALALRYNIHDYPSHDAGQDSLKVGELAVEMANRYGQIRRATRKQLMERQTKWHSNWNQEFASYADLRGFQFLSVRWPHREISLDDQEQGLLFQV